MKIKTEIINLAITGTLALGCVLVYGAFKSMAVKTKTEAWLIAKRNSAIWCSPGAWGGTKVRGHKLPGDTGKGNNCSHQASGSLCITGRRNKVHYC